MASTMKMVSYDMKIKENDILILTSDGVGEHFFDLLKKYQEEIEKLQTAKADSATIKAYTKEQETVIKPQIEIIEQLIARDGLLNEYMNRTDVR